MRLTEFWERTYATSFASDHVITELDGLTVEQALEAGVETKQVWRAVVSAANLPESAR